MKYRILDLDNCIADDGWRIHAIDWRNPDNFKRYAPYHQLGAFDTEGNRDLFTNVNERILIFTARPEFFRPMTVKWLQDKRVHHDMLLMRDDRDVRPSAEVKLDHVLTLLGYGVKLSNIASAFDDHYQVIAMYKEKFGINAELRRIHYMSAYRGAESETQTNRS